MNMVGCPSVRRLSVAISTAGRRLSIYPPTVHHRFDRRLRVYLSVRLPVLYCFSLHPPTTHRRLDRQHTDDQAHAHRTGGLLLPSGESFSAPPTHAAARGRDADLAPPPTTEGEGMSKIDSSCHRHAYRLPC